MPYPEKCVSLRSRAIFSVRRLSSASSRNPFLFLSGRRRISLVAVLWCVFMGPLPSTHGTPTGLNNIPTADVVPERTLVFQAFGFLADGTRPDWWGGFKFGAWKNLEVGFDGQLNAESSGDAVLAGQVKYRIPLWERSAVGLGIANIGDKDRNGETAYYAVLTHDLKVLRAHIGGSFQKDDEGVFGGLDKTLDLFDRELALRTDIRQINERDDLLTSVGFIYDLGMNVLLETWGSFPSDSKDEEALTIKLNYVVSF